MNRIGLILPSSNTTMEPDLYSMAPMNVTIHTTRIPLKDVTAEGLEAMAYTGEEAAELFATADVDVLIYGCTSGSFIKGDKWERDLTKRLSKAARAPAFTTSNAVTEALEILDVKKVSVYTPYTDEVNLLEKRFLESRGFDVECIRGFGYVDNLRIGRIDPFEVISVVEPSPSCESVFISCTNLPIIRFINDLEREHGLPFVTSNQASMWAALRHLGKGPVKGFGTLLTYL